MSELDTDVAKAVQFFWQKRGGQGRRQGRVTGIRDQGHRTAVTGGAQMDGFVSLVRKKLLELGVPKGCIHCNRRLELPGFFRPEKKWDLLVVHHDELIAAIEFKSQIGPSFGNNFNNRTEEAIGNAADVWTAFREGAFKASSRPWLGFLMLLEDTAGSTRPVSVKEPHFPVFEEFRDASYAQRYELLLTRLLRERLYDGTCLLLTAPEQAKTGGYREPAGELSFTLFATGLLGHVRTRFGKVS